MKNEKLTFNMYFMPLLQRIDDVFKSNEQISDVLGSFLCYAANLAHDHTKDEILILCDINNIRFFNDHIFMNKLLKKCDKYIELCSLRYQSKFKNSLNRFLNKINYKNDL